MWLLGSRTIWRTAEQGICIIQPVVCWQRKVYDHQGIWQNRAQNHFASWFLQWLCEYFPCNYLYLTILSSCDSSPACRLWQLRLQCYPRGLGKGSDAALVSSWLDTVLHQMDVDSIPASGDGNNIVTIESVEIYFSTYLGMTIMFFSDKDGFLQLFLVSFPKNRYEPPCMLVGACNLAKENCRDLFRVLKWGHRAISTFFKIIYKGKLWLGPLDAQEAIQSGFAFTVP